MFLEVFKYGLFYGRNVGERILVFSGIEEDDIGLEDKVVCNFDVFEEEFVGLVYFVFEKLVVI